MPATGGQTYYVITARGERGPIDRAAIRGLLGTGEIRGEDQVRNAFGRPLGTVDTLLSAATGSQNISSRRMAQQPIEVPSPEPSRSGIPVVGIVVAALLVVAGIIWFSSRPNEAPEPPQVRAAEPVAVAAAPSGPLLGVPRPIAVTRVTASDAAGATAANLADGDLGTCWSQPLGARDAAGRLAWIVYQTGACRVAAYTLTAAANANGCDPSAWRLVGIEADGQERILDARSDQVFQSRYQRQIYAITTPGDFPAYRLDILECAKLPVAKTMQLGEFALFASLPTSSLEIPGDWMTEAVGGDGSPAPTFDGVQWVVRGSGYDIWGSNDQFRFVYTSVSGDVTLTAHVLAGEGRDQFAKSGLMFRTSVQPDSAQAMLSVKPNGQLDLIYRQKPSAQSTVIAGSKQPIPLWMRLTRRGAQVTGEVSPDGKLWRPSGSIALPELAGPLLVGLAVCSHQVTKPVITRFTDVVVTTP